MDWVVSILTSIIGTGFGAYAGAKLITNQQEAKKRYPRELLMNIISDFSDYSNYKEAEGQFNKRSMIEKKAVLVALKNLGIPVKVNLVDDRFDIDKIEFLAFPVNIKEIEKMKKYVALGLCDDLFFNDIDTGFYQSPPKIIRARGIAIKVLEAAKRLDPSIRYDIAGLARAAQISTSQFEVVYVFWLSVDILEETSSVTQRYDDKKIDSVIQDVKNGIFDHIFYWDFRAYINMNEQRKMAANANIMMNNFPQPLTPTPPLSKDETE